VRTCYTGFVRGVITECLSLVGLISATALACNYHEWLAQTLAPWWRFEFALLDILSFLVLLIGGVFLLVGGVARILSRLIVRAQGGGIARVLGMVAGALRGLWSAGVVLLILLASGRPYLARSIEERSILGPRLVRLSQHSVEWVANRYPGRANRTLLIPPWR